MNQDLIKARKELYAKRDVERNLPCYLSGLAGVYYRMANYNLAMQYTSFLEAVAEGDTVLSPQAKVYADTIKAQVNRLVGAEGSDTEDALQTLLSLRGELTTAMHALTAYTDCLYLHEYALQRLTPGMDGTVEEIDSNAALEEISSFLFFDEEQEGLLARVSAVVSELPIRMTKAKFMEWVRSTASVYQGADAETIDRVFDYRNITEEQYKKAKEILDDVTEFISSVSDVYFSLTEIVNSVLTVVLTGDYIMPEDRAATAGCREIYRMLQEDADFMDPALVEAFESFVGLPEEIEEFLFREEGYLDELNVDEKLLDAMMQKVLYHRVVYARRLHTTSIFVELEEKKAGTESFEDALDSFCKDLTEVLESGQRALNRGVMARVIQNLPLPFTKGSDIQKYVLASLESCHDMSEKTAAMRAIRELAEGM